MSRPTPIWLAVFASLLLALTIATIRAERGHEASSRSVSDHSMVLGEIMVPVEVIETGEDPAVMKIRVQP